MEQSTKNAKMATPTKRPQPVRAKASQSMKCFENSNPNLTSSLPSQIRSNSPHLPKSSVKTQKSARKIPDPVIASPQNRIRQRKFVVAKKKKNEAKDAAVDPDCKCKDKSDGKCLCRAYETLRASQEEFFKSWKDEAAVEEIGPEDCQYEAVNCEPEKAESPGGSSSMKRRREKLMEEARQSVPDPGSGRVLHLVHAFEKLLTIPRKNPEKKDEEEVEEDVKKGMKWALPGLQRPKAPETSESESSFSPEDLVLTAENLGLASQFSPSSDVSQRSSRRSSTGSVRSGTSCSVSSRNVGGRKMKKKQVRVTSQRPFKLRTEERGKEKEEEFFKKLQEMMIQEEKQRIPIAQGLPWTTDEPEVPAKPPVKEITRPLEIKLHSDARAEERSEFDCQVAEKLSLIEQYKMERERQQKLAEEEEIKRLRKEQVPKAQPMPYFDRPFIPKRSVKQPTVPRDPKFRLPQHKKMKSCSSWDDFRHHLCANQQ